MATATGGGLAAVGVALDRAPRAVRACGFVIRKWTRLAGFRGTFGSLRNGFVSMALLALTFPLIGCETPAVDSAAVPDPQQSAMAPDDGALFVFVREFSFELDIDDVKDEDRVLACVQDAVNEEYRRQRITSFDEFSRTTFPGMALESVPRKPEYYAALIESPEFRKRTRSLGLRYIVFVGGVEKTVSSGDILCGGGIYPWCFGYSQWEKASHLGASVLDLNKPAPAKKLAATASGTAWLVVVGIVPIGMPSEPGSVACDDLGTQVARFLRDQQTGREN
jgi:hypothetical protein